MCVINMDFVIEDLNTLLSDNKTMNLVVNAWKEERTFLVENGNENKMIYSLEDSNDLISAIEKGLSSKDIFEMEKERLMTNDLTPYFSFDEDKQYRLFNETDILRLVSKSLNSIAYNILYNPFTPANKDLYKRIVRVMLENQI